MNKLLKDSTLPLPLYYRLKEEIKNNIASGRYPEGSSIPGEFQLMKGYGVSRTTVVKAVTELVNEGFLTRMHGKGTFVTKPEPKFHSHEMIGLAMRTHGHLYGALSSRIIKNLEEHEYYCTIVEVSEKEGNYERIEALIGKNPEVLIVDGHDCFPFHLLDNYRGRIIFVGRCESEHRWDADYILSDYYAGGANAAAHLLSKGFRKIIFITHEIKETNLVTRSFLKGAGDEMSKNGLQEDSLIVFPHKGEENLIKELLKREKKPLGVLCAEDSIAKPVYNSARDLGVKIPDELSVIGYYNTPWCEVFHPELTSVSIREKEIADIAAERIIENTDGSRNITLEPVLVERGSVIE